jgi:hypothetical protein
MDGVVREVSLDGGLPASGERLPSVRLVRVGARYFETLGLPVMRGRGLRDIDATPGHEGVVIDDQLAHQFFAGRNPLGQPMTLLDDARSPQRVTIVGVVPSLRQSELTQAPPMVYLPYPLDPVSGMSLLARSQNHAATAEQLRTEVRALDADLPLWDIRTVEESVSRMLWVNRVFGGMFAIFAMIGVVVATVGVYGVVAYTTSQRTQEIGIRAALGATRAELAWTFVRPKLLQVGLGLAVGSITAFFLLGLMGGLLVGRFGQDGSTLLAGATFLTVAALASMLWPVFRATAANPVSALRYE